MNELISSSNYEHFKCMRNKLIKKQFNVCELDKTSLATFVIDLNFKNKTYFQFVSYTLVTNLSFISLDHMNTSSANRLQIFSFCDDVFLIERSTANT